jgi:hypothetical protein
MASNQYLGQLKEKIQHALFGNVGTLISFNVGAGENGAKTLAENLSDTVIAKDLTMLPSYQAYLKTKLTDKDEPVVFSFTTIPVSSHSQTPPTITQINTTSLKTYGQQKTTLQSNLTKKQTSPSQYFLEGV